MSKKRGSDRGGGRKGWKRREDVKEEVERSSWEKGRQKGTEREDEVGDWQRRRKEEGVGRMGGRRSRGEVGEGSEVRGWEKDGGGRR